MRDGVLLAHLNCDARRVKKAPPAFVGGRKMRVVRDRVDDSNW